jgi:hypothetical protein
MHVRGLTVWFLLLALAIANGAFREGFLVQRFDSKVAHAISTVMLSALILAAAWLTASFVRYRSATDAWIVGILWLGLTLAFEFLAGHYLFGQPWNVLLADYDILHGRIWPLVLVATLLAPVLAWSGK